MAYDKDTLEQHILDVAERHLFRFGYKNFNLDTIAKDIGISKTTLYKIVEGKYVLAERVIARVLSRADEAMTHLLSSQDPLPDQLKDGMEILSSVFAKMDPVFLEDLSHTVPALWEKIDAARIKKEKHLVLLLQDAQKKGILRSDLEAELMAPMLLALVRSLYHPAFFLSHQSTSDVVGETIIEVFLQGTLKSQS